MAKPTKSYVEAGAHFTEMTKQQAEAFVKTLAKSGGMRRRDAEQLLQLMVSRGRETKDRMSALVQSEVAKQLKVLSERLDDIEGRLESLASSLKDGIVGAASGVSGTAGSPASASTPGTSDATNPKAAANKTVKRTAKKTGASKDSKKPAKKSRAKKSGARKSSAKRTATKSATPSAAEQSSSAPDAVGSSGVRKVSTSRPAAASE
jgi:polyhydroxyalkanoate synthesis regulator phasin